MRSRMRYWGRAAVFGWQQVIGLKDHIELAIVLLLFGLALAGISLVHGPSWLLPSMLMLAFAAMVLDGAFVQWRAADSEVSAGMASRQPAPRHVPRNRDQIVAAIHELERACRRVVSVAEELRNAGYDIADLAAVDDEFTPDEWSKAVARVGEAEEQLVLARRMAGPGFRMHLMWIQLDISDEAFDCAYGDDPDFHDALEKMAAVVERAVYRLDNGELWIDGDFPGGTWKTNFAP